jgi:hypothetical protein
LRSGQYSDGRITESAGAEYLFGKAAILPYKTAYAVAAFTGAVMSLSVVWNVADTLNMLMAVPNLVCILLLSGVITEETKYYLEGGNIEKIDKENRFHHRTAPQIPRSIKSKNHRKNKLIILPICWYNIACYKKILIDIKKMNRNWMKAAGRDCKCNTEGVSTDFAENCAMISGKEDRSRTGLWKAQAPKGQLPGTRQAVLGRISQVYNRAEGIFSFCSVFVFAVNVPA